MNYDAILVRFGELSIKGKNRGFFLKQLVTNLVIKLELYAEYYTLKKEYDRILIFILDKNFFDKISNIVLNVFGIMSISLVKMSSLDIKDITDATIELVKYYQPKTFKLEIHRNNKKYYLNSTEIKQYIAPIILKEFNFLNVDVKKPELQINIEVRKDKTYLFINKLSALGGLPVGTSGKGLVLLSGGIDSPVASFLGLKRGMEVEMLHFITPPHTTSESLEKVITLTQKLVKYANNNFIKLHVVDFSMMQHEIMHIKENSYRILIMRRMFFRIAEKICKKNKCQALITGESLGQVASQTIESLNISSSVISKIPILRPLIFSDKLEIISLAEKINTYKISILPYEDCCSLFVPKNPVTKPVFWLAENQEKSLMWKEIIAEITNNFVTTYFVKEREYLIEK